MKSYSGLLKWRGALDSTQRSTKDFCSMFERETEATNSYVKKGAVLSCDVQKELPCVNKTLVYLEHRNTVTPPVKYACSLLF